MNANDPDDRVTVDLVRRHLRAITDHFSRGVFDKPFATHAEVPNGVLTLQQLASALTYTFEQTPAGGQYASAA